MTNPTGAQIEIEPMLEDFGAIVHGVEFRDPDATRRGTHRIRPPLR